MKQVLAISGSASQKSSNTELLKLICNEFQNDYQITVFSSLSDLPLFSPEKLKQGIPEEVSRLKSGVSESDAVIISTPEYLHNIPAVLKNALEWMTESGELADKPVLAITFTPAPPRGENAMKSLLQSLKASKAKIVAELPLYNIEVRNNKKEMSLNQELHFLLKEAFELF